MNANATSTLNSTAELDSALDAIRSAPASVPRLIDFDETLFLRNSTEEYLRSAKPRFLAIFLLQFLEYVKPWRLCGTQRSKAVRDWVRVMLITTLFPWTRLLWPCRARVLAQTDENGQLAEAIAHNPASPVIIASNGFDFIIRPILQHMKSPWDQLIACRAFLGAIDRCRGKKQLVEAALGAEAVQAAILITDSLDDQALLNTVSSPYWVTWEIPESNSSFSRGYIPFFYMEKLKKPNQNFFIKAILVDEFIPLTLLLSWSQPHPVLHGIGLGFMVLSFWCVYEIGYMENDVIAEKHERNPNLAEAYLKSKHRIDFHRPWLWSLALAVPGLALWQLIQLPTPWSLETFENPALLATLTQTLAVQLGQWGLFLFLTRTVFCLYNYVDEKSRVWLYPILQVLKFSGFLLFTPINPLATLYLLCLVNSRWVPYFVYRYGNLPRFPDFPMQLVHFFGVISLTLPLGISGAVSFVPEQLTALLTLASLRASKQIITMLRNTRFFLDPQPQSSKVGRWAALLFPKV